MAFLGITILLVVVDQVSKQLVRSMMVPGETIPLVPNIFHLTYVQNPGAAFGILAHRTNFFIIITLAVIVLILLFFWRISPEHKMIKTALALQLGGAVGNLIDRLLLGHVTDFFDFRIWPVFNIADMAVVVGVGLLCWEILKSSPDKKKQEFH